MDTRLNSLKLWLESAISKPIDSILPASADASFRRYFRVSLQNTTKTLIAMDAPPEHEDNRLFVKCAKTMKQCGLNAPKIFNTNFKDGFLLVEDLGATTYQDKFNTDLVIPMYKAALDALIKLQVGTKTHANNFTKYDANKLLDEMSLFQEWYVSKHLDITLDNEQLEQLTAVQSLLTDCALEQPQVLVHRDYHCRNLLTNSGNYPGVIDFQDMVVGAMTYDLVSLLKDCYVEWSEEFIDEMLEYYLQQANKQNLFKTPPNFEQLKYWFDWMGVQRHLKVLGVFTRLNYRDNKPQYLNDLPLVKKYVVETCNKYKNLASLAELIASLKIAKATST